MDQAQKTVAKTDLYPGYSACLQSPQQAVAASAGLNLGLPDVGERCTCHAFEPRALTSLSLGVADRACLPQQSPPGAGEQMEALTGPFTWLIQKRQCIAMWRHR